MHTTARPHDHWTQWADCAQSDPEAWFPEPGESLRRDLAVAVCAACPVRVECLAEALKSGMSEGIWGGIAQVPRARLAAEYRRTAQTAVQFASGAVLRADIQADVDRAMRAAVPRVRGSGSAAPGQPLASRRDPSCVA
jgi:WhiB family redox-sensing transcriptional regulator